MNALLVYCFILKFSLGLYKGFSILDDGSGFCGIWLFYLIETFFQFTTSVKKHSKLWIILFLFDMLIHSFIWSRLSHLLLIWEE